MLIIKFSKLAYFPLARLMRIFYDKSSFPTHSWPLKGLLRCSGRATSRRKICEQIVSFGALLPSPTEGRESPSGD